MDEEQTAPKVTGSPDAIWLVYGELDDDATHAECYMYGDVTWCDAAQYPADVEYVRSDLVAQRVRDAVAAQALEVAKLRGEIAMLRATMESAAYQLTKARIWNGMGWQYNVLHPLHYKPALDRLREVLDGST